VATGAGGAIYYRHSPDQKGGLEISGTSFINNKAGNGGGIYYQKTTTKGAKLVCAGCVFNGNEADYGSAIMTTRSDTKDNDKAGTRLTLSLSTTTFSSARRVGTGAG